MITPLFTLENLATIEMRSGYSVLLPYTSSGLMNGIFTISFFDSKLKNMYDESISDFFF